MSYDIIKEDVPVFTKRVGDHVIHGSNNTVIVLGTDRAKNGPATVDDGLGHIKAEGKGTGAGAIHIIAGMKDKEDGNPDLKDDKAYVYLSMKTEVDKNANLSSVEGDGGKAAAFIAKADCLRLVFRKDVKICTEDGSTYIHIKKDQIVLEGNVKLGKGAQEKIIKGDAFKTFFMKHQHPTGVGPSGPPIEPFTPDLLSSRTIMVE